MKEDDKLFISDTVVPKLRGFGVEVTGVEVLPSAQQSVYLLHCASSSNNHSNCNKQIAVALETGHNKLIVRRWRNAARYWSMNVNDLGMVSTVAECEVSAYRYAYLILCDKVPRVLYYSNNNDNNTSITTSKVVVWAVLSYVGEHSSYYDSHSRRYNREFTRNMVKTRLEYGFEEPHPRHGRVCTDDSLQYALHVMKEVVIPIHRYFYSSHDNLSSASIHKQNSRSSINDHFLRGSSDTGWTYDRMLNLYDYYLTMMKHFVVNEVKQKDRTTEVDCCLNLDTWMERIKKLIKVLLKVVNDLKHVGVNPVKNCLCHCDLQPQNLMFFDSQNKYEKNSANNNIPELAFVLDWEEAVMADPRFEIMLICRKVCANEDQATVVWEYYRKYMQVNFGVEMGPLYPWIYVEGVHSIITLLLQGLNLNNKGRTPWESFDELKQKLNRELKRQVKLGQELYKAVVE